MKLLLAGALAVLGLSMTACTPFASLQLIVDTTEAAIPILQSAGVPIPPQVAQYVGDVAGCIGGQVGNPDPTQLALIASCLTEKVAPNLPPGTPQAVANIIAKIVQAVANYIQHPPVGLRAGKTPAVLSGQRAAKLTELRMRAQQTQTAAKALVKK